MSDSLNIDFEGKSYRVSYSVEGGIITVRTMFDSKSTQVGGSPPQLLAEIMGEELLTEAKRKGLL